MFLATKTADRFELVFEGDPAVSGEGTGWIPLDQATIKKGEAADVFVCRPLNSDECFRIMQATKKDAAFLSFAASLGVVEIRSGKKKIEDSEEIQEILDNAQNMAPILSLASTIFQVSREGLDALPFRPSGPPVE
tara:strand:+ start:2675 stop:3079 length:405 start_codon:yes stop_codon:yes gene_type:complete